MVESLRAERRHVQLPQPQVIHSPQVPAGRGIRGGSEC